MNRPEQVSAQPCRGPHDRGPWNDPDPSNIRAHAVYPYPVQSASRCATSMSPFGAYPLEHMLYSARLMGLPQASSPAALHLMQHHLADPRQQWLGHPQMWPPGIGPQQPSQPWRGRLCGGCPPPVHGAYPHMPGGMLQQYHAQPWRQPHPPPGDPPGYPQQDQASRGSQGEHAESPSRPANGLAVMANGRSRNGSSSSISSSSRHQTTPHVSQLRASAPSFPTPVSAAASTNPSQPPAARHHLPEPLQIHPHDPHVAVTTGPQIRAAQQRALKKKAKLQKALGEVSAGGTGAGTTAAQSPAAAPCSSPSEQAAGGKPRPATTGDKAQAAGDPADDAVLEGHGNDSESQSSEAADLAEAVSHLPKPGTGTQAISCTWHFNFP